MLSFYAMAIDTALQAVRDRINKAAIRAGRAPDEIKLVSVSKTIELDRIIEAINAGAVIFGENRVQEARDKISDLKSRCGSPLRVDPTHIPDSGIEWHLIGNLQKNKANTAVKLFDLIHSVDSIELAEELNKQSGKIGKIQPVLIQVKLSDEAMKKGVPEEELDRLLEKITEMPNLRLEGLMTMPPFFNEKEKTRPYFRRLAEIARQSKKRGFNINELSMGMSNDFEIAIEEGSTLVRVGTDIFGKRNYRESTG